jgi:RNA polymerase sigma factor (sigma-70 family)
MRETEAHHERGDDASAEPGQVTEVIGALPDPLPQSFAAPPVRAQDPTSLAVQAILGELDAPETGHMHFDLGALRDPDADPEAHQREWRRLVAHFVPRLDSYFQLKVPAPDDRDDLIQHILVKAVLNVRGIQASAALWNWLRKIGDNRLFDLRRSAQSTARHIEQQAAELMAETQAHATTEVCDARLDPANGDGALGRRIAALNDVDRRLLDLVANEVPHEEIALRLGLASADASRQRWSRLRRKLRAP